MGVIRRQCISLISSLILRRCGGKNKISGLVKVEEVAILAQQALAK
jgi:hypothetical protein